MLKEKLENIKTRAGIAATTGSLALGMLPVTALASGGTEGVNVSSTMTTVANSVKTEIMSTLGAVLPIAGTIVAAVIAITFGFKIIKRFMG